MDFTVIINQLDFPIVVRNSNVRFACLLLHGTGRKFAPTRTTHTCRTPCNTRRRRRRLRGNRDERSDGADRPSADDRPCDTIEPKRLLRNTLIFFHQVSKRLHVAFATVLVFALSFVFSFKFFVSALRTFVSFSLSSFSRQLKKQHNGG